MELYIRLQLQTMGAAFGLGCGAMLVYDLLRTVRLARRRRAVTHVTDLLYVLAVGWALLRFALSIGRGELRLYVLPCAALGTFFSLKVLAPVFRPVWRFWLDAAPRISTGLFIWTRMPRRKCGDITKHWEPDAARQAPYFKWKNAAGIGGGVMWVSSPPHGFYFFL